ncbi:MAG: ABC transporter ATP-binding protein [Planctomycetes bacterium]|nr:ABC transporter ATP-binding protein [Planctomycetota bacterium]
MAIASLRQIGKTYGESGTAVRVEALKGIDLEFAEGDFVAVCGQSGSGKSTLMNLIGCLDRPSAGQYLLGGVDVARLSDDDLSDIRGRRIGFVFQTFNLIPQLTVLENLEIPLFYQGTPPQERRRKAIEIADAVELGDRGHHRPNELSGGQQQRAAIARSIINDPLIILADEPTGNLDTTTGHMILDLFEKLNREGKTIIMVTHEPDVADRCGRVVTLRDGQILSDTKH